MVVFSQKADENIATLVKALDQVQKTNKEMGTLLVGVRGVEAADLEKLQDTHKLTTPLTIASDKDGPKSYKLNKEAAVTVLVYKRGGAIHSNFAFADSQSAVAKAGKIAAAAEEAFQIVTKKDAKNKDAD